MLMRANLRRVATDVAWRLLSALWMDLSVVAVSVVIAGLLRQLNLARRLTIKAALR